MTSIRSLVIEFEHAGGSLTLEGEMVKARYPDDQRRVVASILPRLRAHRGEVARLLHERLAGPKNRLRELPAPVPESMGEVDDPACQENPPAPLGVWGTNRGIAEPTPEDKLYSEMANDALDRIAARPYLPGAVAWLKQAYPDIHRELTVTLPRKIDQLWDRRAPIGFFRAILDRWAELHAHVIELYEGREVAGKG